MYIYIYIYIYISGVEIKIFSREPNCILIKVFCISNLTYLDSLQKFEEHSYIYIHAYIPGLDINLLRHLSCGKCHAVFTCPGCLTCPASLGVRLQLETEAGCGNAPVQSLMNSFPVDRSQFSSTMNFLLDL